MLIRVDELQQQYRDMTTEELLALSRDGALTDTARTILQQELLQRDDLVEGLDRVEPPTTRTTRRGRGYYIPSPYHKVLHASAVILILPLLKVAGYSSWLATTIAVIAAWLCSSWIVASLCRWLPCRWQTSMLLLLPAVYLAGYYGIYLLLYRLS